MYLFVNHAPMLPTTRNITSQASYGASRRKNVYLAVILVRHKQRWLAALYIQVNFQRFSCFGCRLYSECYTAHTQKVFSRREIRTSRILETLGWASSHRSAFSCVFGIAEAQEPRQAWCAGVFERILSPVSRLCGKVWTNLLRQMSAEQNR